MDTTQFFKRSAVVTVPFIALGGSLFGVATAATSYQATSNKCSDTVKASSMVTNLKDAPIDPRHVSWATMKDDQKQNAKIIHDSVQAHGGDTTHLMITLMVAIAESEIKALDYGDLDSLGMFQQRANWGPADKRKDAKWSTDRFLTQDTPDAPHNGTLGYLDKEKAGQITAKDPWMIAQQVQASGTPDGSNYKAVMGNAQDIMKHLGEITPSCDSGGGAGKGDDYPFKSLDTVHPNCEGATGYDPDPITTPLGGWVCQCVDFVAWRLNQKAGGTKDKIVFHNRGSATDWPANFPDVPRDNNPQIGDAAIRTAGFHSAGFGHVAYVTKVEGDTVWVEEYNEKTPLKYDSGPTEKSSWSTFMHFGEHPKPS